MKGLSLAGWKKIASDKKTTTLQHDKGHIMTLAHASLPKIQQEALKRIKFAEGGDVSSDSQDDKAPAPVTVNVGTPPQAPVMQTAAPVAPANIPIPKAPSVVNPNGGMNPGGPIPTALAGAKLGSDVMAAQSAAEVAPLQENIANQKALNDAQTQNQNMVNKAFTDLKTYTNDPKTKFNENAYLENMGAGRKMGTALGLILGGAGSGITGQPNMAMEFLNKQIDRNIEAQKTRYGQQQNVWGAAKDLFSDNNVADKFARAHQLDMLNTKAQLIAKQLGTPQAAANLLKLQSEIAPAISKSLQESAVNVGILPGYRGQPSSGGGNEPDQSSNKMPGMGKANGIQNASFTPQGEEQPKMNSSNLILKPGAGDIIANKIKYDPSIPAADKTKMANQLTQAAQAEKVLSNVDNVFDEMVAQSRSGGVMGRFHRTISPHVLAGVGAGLGTLVSPGVGTAAGGAAGEAVGQGLGALTNNDMNRRYDSFKSQLAGKLSAAVPRGAEFVEKLLDKNAPEYGDEPQTLKAKVKAIKDFIKEHIETDALETHGAAYKR